MKIKKDSDGMPRTVHECEDCKPMTQWFLKQNGAFGDVYEGDRIVATMEVNRAARTVRAVNAHEEMVKALKDVLFVLKGQASIGNFMDSSERDISLEGVVEQALAKAEEK